MIKTTYKIQIEGNLLDLPSGPSYSEFGPGQATPLAKQHYVTRIPNKMSQRAFTAHAMDTLNVGEYDTVKMKIFVGGQQKWTYAGPIDSVRSFAYKKAIDVGATHGCRSRSKPEDGYTFTIEVA